jgi:endonuclease/exonuclease/phosphatase family metal-dependent hydrolase
MTNSVMFYNVFMRHQNLFSNKQEERCLKIVEAIPKDVKILVLIELFDEKTEELFSKKLYEKGFIYRTETYGNEKIRSRYQHNSGVIIFSQYPILEEGFHKFSASSKRSFERYANKGIVYARIQTLLKDPIKVYATHLHSMIWSCFNSYREKQWIECMDYINFTQQEYKHEMLIFGGDMNQDFKDAKNLANIALTNHLLPARLDKDSDLYTLDPANPLVGNELGSWLKPICKRLFIPRPLRLDYAFSNRVGFKTMIDKVDQLSDHYAVKITYY